HIQTRKYNWDLFYFTKELGPATTRDLVMKFLVDRKKELTEPQRILELAKFFAQAGWLKEADRELERITTDSPDEKKKADAMRESTRRLGADKLAEEIDRASKVGQHQLAQSKIANFFKEELGPLVSEKNLLAVQDLKTKYEEQAEKLAKVKTFLAE